MRADIFLAALAGASSASATVMRIAAESSTYDWAVTGWTAGCARAGCYYNFNVTGAANLTGRPPVPAFKAYCNGMGEGAPYAPCERLDDEDTDARVVAKLLPSVTAPNGTRPVTIQVSLEYSDLYTPGTWWNYTGHGTSFYNQVVAPAQNFTITIDEIFGVA
ncbi:hypothetical protein F5Y19DRAFT_315957 [Xylariaceae sp. FL1651]|nr:hypothetical protein F5Y19DRAFT_315957 [Xylariaceae sp. FL1651]